MFGGCPATDAPKPDGAADCEDCPNEKGAGEGVAIFPVPNVAPNADGFFCGDSIIVSPSACELVVPFVGAPNPPKLMLLPLLSPVLFPRPLNGFEVVCGAKVKAPDGGGGAKLMLEAIDGGKEALVLKFVTPVLLLLPKDVEN